LETVREMQRRKNVKKRHLKKNKEKVEVVLTEERQEGRIAWEDKKRTNGGRAGKKERPEDKKHKIQ